MSSSKSSPRDFSLFSLFTAGLACFAPLASAYTQPKGAEPKGNPISEPGLNDLVPVGEPFTITWKPTTPGTVTLVLLKGPAENAVPQYAIAEKVENHGTYVWVPKDNLAPGATGYGIQLIDDATGQYQYTTQFGISNPDYGKSGSDDSDESSSHKGSSHHGGAPHYGGGAPHHGGSSHHGGSPHHGGYPHQVHHGGSWSSKTTPSHAKPTASTGGTPGTIVLPTGWSHNATTIKPTGTGASTGRPKPTWHHTQAPTSGSAAAPSPYAPSTTGAPSPSATGGAATLATSFGGLVLAAGVAVFAL